MKKFTQYEDYYLPRDNSNITAGYNCGRKKNHLPSLDDYDNNDEDMYDCWSGNDRRKRDFQGRY